MRARLRAWNASLDDPIDLRALAVLRIAMGPIVLIHLRPFLESALDGIIYSDRFTLPFWDWYPEPSRPAYLVLLAVTAAAAVLLSLGLFTRAAAWFTAAGVTYNVFLSQTHFHHNRAFLIILLVGLAVLPAGRTTSLDAWWARRRGVPLPNKGGTRLALTVLRFEIAVVYLASGFNKLIDPDWWGGTVTRLRVEGHRPRLSEVGLPEGVIDLLADPGFQSMAAKLIVLTELFIGLGLLLRRTRKAAIWVAIPFHVAIQFTAAVQVFSFAALAALVVWIDRPARSRTLHVPERSRWAPAIGVLDWTGRFSVEIGEGPMTVTDGSRTLSGHKARRFVLSRLPATFWFAAPLQLLRRS